MEVSYELTPEDAWQYVSYYRQKQAVLRPVFLRCLFGLVGFVLLIAAVMQAHDWGTFHQLHWFLPLMLAVTVLLAFPFLSASKKRVTESFGQQPGYFCEHQVSISPEGFAEKTFVSSHETAWAAFHSVEENSACVFLFRSRNSAFIVPKRAFTSPHEAERFANTARRYLDAAKTRTPITAEDAAVWPPAPRPGA